MEPALLKPESRSLDAAKLGWRYDRYDGSASSSRSSSSGAERLQSKREAVPAVDPMVPWLKDGAAAGPVVMPGGGDGVYAHIPAPLGLAPPDASPLEAVPLAVEDEDEGDEPVGGRENEPMGPSEVELVPHMDTLEHWTVDVSGGWR